jgi:hypothetical protein
MPTLLNKTRRALAIPLPGGKKLRLGPFQSGQVKPKALEHPPLKKLIEAGDIELTGDKQGHGESTANSKRPTPGRHNPGAGGIRHTGDG